MKINDVLDENEALREQAGKLISETFLFPIPCFSSLLCYFWSVYTFVESVALFPNQNPLIPHTLFLLPLCVAFGIRIGLFIYFSVVKGTFPQINISVETLKSGATLSEVGEGPHCVGMVGKEHGFHWPGMSSVITAYCKVKVHFIC